MDRELTEPLNLLKQGKKLLLTATMEVKQKQLPMK